MNLPMDLGFESHPHDRRTMVRRDARDTEIAAAAAVERRLTESHALVRAAFRRQGSMTDEQLEQLPEFADWAPSTARKRRSELMMAGELVAVGDARNSRGRAMTIWGLKATNSRPVMNSPADEAEARDRINAAPGKADPDAPCRGETGMSSGSEARPVIATAHPSTRAIAHGDRVRILATRELGEVVGIEDEFQPAFARRYRVHRSIDLFTGRSTWHDAGELELA